MSLLSEIFSDLFARQDNFLARMDSRIKLILALAMLFAVIFSSTPAFPLGMMALCMASTLSIGVPKRLVLLRLAAPLGIATVLLILQSLMTGSTPVFHIDLFGVKIVILREGLANGFLLGSRVLGGVSVMLLLSAVTPAHRIFLAMRALGMPQGWVEIAMLMYRYIFVLLELTGDVTSAQKVRLGYAGVRRGLTSAGILSGTVVLRSMDQAVSTHEAMQVRGYRGEIPFGPMPSLTKRDGAIIAGATAALLVFYFAMEALCR